MRPFLKLGVLLVVFFASTESSSTEFLRVNGTKFFFGQSSIFLNGVNFAWHNYAYDFGNNQYVNNAPVLEAWLTDVRKSGGNIARVWLHMEGQQTPQFDSNGFASSPDRDGTLISDLSKFLDVAASNNVFIILVLWNGAVGIDRVNGNFKELIMNDSKLDAYISNVLKPMVKALKTKPALAAWEIMNEPEGSLEISTDSSKNSCFDTITLAQMGAGWTNSSIPMKPMLKFINRNAAAIKTEDPKALITLGSWSHLPQTDAYPKTFNYYKDSCLIAAGGKKSGTIDFHQMHSYSWQGKFAPNSPFLVEASSYLLDKPLIIGEFSANCGANKTVEELWGHAYTSGYQGILGWQFAGGECSDTPEEHQRGMNLIKTKASSLSNNNGQVSIQINSSE